MNKYIELIIKAKEKRGIESDAEFCKLIKIDPSTWTKIKNGEREIGNIVLSRLMVAIPELTVETMAYMKERGSK